MNENKELGEVIVWNRLPDNIDTLMNIEPRGVEAFAKMQALIENILAEAYAKAEAAKD